MVRLWMLGFSVLESGVGGRKIVCYTLYLFVVSYGEYAVRLCLSIAHVCFGTCGDSLVVWVKW